MPRRRKTRKAINTPGEGHELTFSCNHRLPMLDNDRARRWFLEALEKARIRHRFELWAYVIMPEHAHVVLLPVQCDYDMSLILKAIKQSVARKAVDYARAHAPAFLERLKVVWPTGRIEYRFWMQGGGYDRNIDEPRTGWRMVEYAHGNPYRRGLVMSPTDWPWSSARVYAGLNDGLFPLITPPP